MTGYLPLSTFVFRTPYYPISALSDFKRYLHGSVFKEMLQIAALHLNESIDKSTERAQFAAYRYYQRACTRPTPFGLFAGCSIGKVGEHTDIRLSEQKEYKRITRLDMNYICAITQQIERDKNIREQLHYYPNTGMYPVGDHLRYVEYHYRKTRRIHQINQVEHSEYLQSVLTLAQKGARFSELVESLIDDEITKGESIQFIHELIDMQLLVSELEHAVTNIQPLKTLIAKLNGLQSLDKLIINALSEIDKRLTLIDQQPIGKTGDIYLSIVKNIEKTSVEAEIKYLFQTDMFKPVQHATVSRRLIRDVQQTLLFLNKITRPSSSNKNLIKFKENFVKRYESREMPLLFILDNELGIGYADNTSGDISPLIDDLAVPRENSPQEDRGTSIIQSVLMQRYQQSSQKVIELTDEDVKGMEAVWDDLPPTISVVCEILKDNAQGSSFHIKSAGGMSAASFLGRFCHLDEQILNHTLAITEKEAQMHPDAVFAEIVHLPESRVGNILLRPVLRPYEIPYLAKAGVSNEFELRPDDLFVSVKNNRIRLRSGRLKREIVPRMSTAHNYSGQNPMPVYHFLCDLQHQEGRKGVGIFWNETAQQLDYLPRITYKNCILSQASWTVRKKEIKELINIKDDSELLLKIKEWQNGRNIPDSVVLADGDNELYIDMNHPLSIRAWLSVVKRRPSFRLEEFLFDPTTAVVHGSNGVFTNEFIFAFYREGV